MGRHAGFLTAASALARKYPDDGPHLIYLPERALVLDKFLAEVKAVHDRLGRCVIAVSEGVHDEAGGLIVGDEGKAVERDAHGNVQLSGSGALAELLCAQIKARLGIKRVRGDTFGYLQRSFFGCVSEVDQREAREVGEKAVQFAMGGDGDGSVTIRRVGSYAVDYVLAPLGEIAGRTRLMDDGFIVERRRRRHRGIPRLPSPAAGRAAAGCGTAARGGGAARSRRLNGSRRASLQSVCSGLGFWSRLTLPEALVLRDHLRAEQQEGRRDLQAQHHHDRRGQRAVDQVDLRRRLEVPDEDVAADLPQQRGGDAAGQRDAAATGGRPASRGRRR